jgi:TatD DNase family protein
VTLSDSHCHLDDKQFDSDRDEAVQRAIDAGVSTMIAIGTGEGPPDLESAIRLADRYGAMYATAGIHPEHAPKATDAGYKHLAEILRHPKCVALGEIGLDYYWKPFDKDLQQSVFVEQMRIAHDARKPIVIHTRDAWDDTVGLLRKHWAGTGLPCIMHCFSGGPEQAAEVIGLDFYVSFAGIVTYPKALDVQAAAKIVSLDRLLVETDAPYLAPVPHRGKRNEPAYVAHTARRIAELRGEEEASVVNAASANLRRIIGYTEVFR